MCNKPNLSSLKLFDKLRKLAFHIKTKTKAANRSHQKQSTRENIDHQQCYPKTTNKKAFPLLSTIGAIATQMISSPMP